MPKKKFRLNRVLNLQPPGHSWVQQAYHWATQASTPPPPDKKEAEETAFSYKILDQSKLKWFSDDKINVIQK